MLIRCIVTLFLLASSLDYVYVEAAGFPNSSTNNVAYPPYPDVWDWKIPESERSSDLLVTPEVNVKVLDNGDVIIAYVPDMTKPDMKYITLFGNKIINSTAGMYKDDYLDDAKSIIRLWNGKVIKRLGDGMRSKGCLDELDFNIVTYDNSEKNILNNITLLYLFDKPKIFETKGSHCMDGPSFSYRLHAVEAAFLPLKDGTFLLIAIGDGYIIRFDENFNTRSKLINNKFFIIETGELKRFASKYGDRSNGDKKMKQLYADLSAMLISRKKGEGR